MFRLKPSILKERIGSHKFLDLEESLKLEDEGWDVLSEFLDTSGVEDVEDCNVEKIRRLRLKTIVLGSVTVNGVFL